MKESVHHTRPPYLYKELKVCKSPSKLSLTNGSKDALRNASSGRVHPLISPNTPGIRACCKQLQYVM